MQPHDLSGMPVDDVENVVSEPERLLASDARSRQIDNYARALTDLHDALPEVNSGAADAALARAQEYMAIAIGCVRGAAECERAHEALGATEAGEG